MSEFEKWFAGQTIDTSKAENQKELARLAFIEGLKIGRGVSHDEFKSLMAAIFREAVIEQANNKLG